VTISDFRVERVHFRIEYRMPLMSSVLGLKMMHSLHDVNRGMLALKVTNKAVPFRKEHFREGYVTIRDFPSGEGTFPN
jgi:hypothetical protein